MVNKMSERKLASIEIIENLAPIEGADFIERCKLQNLEWQFVVKREEFKVGDMAVFFEIDSLLPDIPLFEFMKCRKLRVKTIKLKGTISQGLAMPVNLFPELKNINLKVGMDVTEILKIEKYLTPSEKNEKLLINQKKERFWKKYFSFKKTKGWPTFIKKTDEERIQNLNWKNVYEQFKENKFYITEKVDGQSVTYFTKKYKILKIFNRKYLGVCSRNIWLKSRDNSDYWKSSRKYNIEKILKEQKNEMIIQAEQYGPGIQKNRYQLNEIKIMIFNIIEIKNNNEYHYNYDEMEQFCEKYNLPIVPLLGKKFHFFENIEDMIKISIGVSSINKNIKREGVVIRLIENGIKKLSFKIISSEYLLKYEE